MIGRNRREVLVDLDRAVAIAVRGKELRVAVGEAERALVGLVGGLQTPLGLAGVAEFRGDQPSVKIPKRGDRGVTNAIKRLERVPEVVLSRVAPRRQQGRRHVARLRVLDLKLRPGEA